MFIHFRNLSFGATDKVIESIIKQGILQPLSQLLLQQFSNDIAPELNSNGCVAQSQQSSIAEEDDADATQIFIHATNLLWTLW